MWRGAHAPNSGARTLILRFGSIGAKGGGLIVQQTEACNQADYPPYSSQQTALVSHQGTAKSEYP